MEAEQAGQAYMAEQRDSIRLRERGGEFVPNPRYTFSLEQLQYMRIHGLHPEEAIDFPCSPTWAGYYTERGLTNYNPPPVPAEIAPRKESVRIETGDKKQEVKQSAYIPVVGPASNQGISVRVRREEGGR
jgi:hypothetical protein